MKPSHSSSKKVLVIGAGIGGLSCGIILAKLGFEVTVLEKNLNAGGLMRSYSRNGVDCPVGIHYLGSLDEGQILRKFFDNLGVTAAIPVERMGQDGIIDRYIFDSAGKKKIFDLPPSIEAYAENLRQLFPAERGAIAEIIAPIKQAARQLHSLDLLYAADNDFALLDQAEPYGKFLDDLHCSPGLRTVLAVPSSWIGVPLNDCPVFYHNMALASYVSSAWRLKKTGADMAAVFVRRLRELGGKIITNAEIEKINISDRVITGVQLESGEDLSATIVIGAIHPQIVLKMLPAGAVKPSYYNRINNLKNTHGVFSLQALVDSGVQAAIPYNIFRLTTDRNGNIPDLQYYQIRKTGQQETNLLSILTSGSDDLWTPWLHTKSGRRGQGYLYAKEKHACHLIKKAEEIFGALPGVKVIDTYTPLTIRDWVNSPDGSAYGVLRSTSQTLAAALLNRTSVRGLYLAGQSVMASGIIGTIMGSYSTVKQIIGSAEFTQEIKIC